MKWLDSEVKKNVNTEGNDSIIAEEKKRDLYLRQKELLATLLEHGAISQAQSAAPEKIYLMKFRVERGSRWQGSHRFAVDYECDVYYRQP